MVEESVLANRLTGPTYYIAEDPNEPSAVLDWFRRQEDVPQEFPKEGGSVLLYFREVDELGRKASGNFDQATSPLVGVFPSKVRRGALWTVGEVHFLTKNLPRAFPRFGALRRRFEKWLLAHPQVFDQANPGRDYAYYLEGSLQNIAPKVFALPSALDALKAGQYFVANDDNDCVLDKLCNNLRLRGVACGQSSPPRSS